MEDIKHMIIYHQKETGRKSLKAILEFAKSDNKLLNNFKNEREFLKFAQFVTKIYNHIQQYKQQ